MASLPSHVQNVRSLYKRILVLHRMLPLHFKALGDQYVKEEFRRHKNASPQEAKLFMEEWECQNETLMGSLDNFDGWFLCNLCHPYKGSLRVGSLSFLALKLNCFREEQIGQLFELMQETTKQKHQFDVIEDGQK
uniref:Succinate dehydrogenase assembly factor 3 n=1 Tax=Xenopus tropicalis TaxID=8364 RepID=A0A1B8Y7A1_XENTR